MPLDYLHSSRDPQCERLERHLAELDRRTQDLVEKGELTSHLARHGLRLAKGHERTHFSMVRLKGWPSARRIWVQPLPGFETCDG